MSHVIVSLLNFLYFCISQSYMNYVKFLTVEFKNQPMKVGWNKRFCELIYQLIFIGNKSDIQGLLQLCPKQSENQCKHA